MSDEPAHPSIFRRGGWLLLALPLWVFLYAVNHAVSEWLAFRLLGLTPKSHLGDAVAFLFYDTPKVLLLLTLVVFIVTFIQTKPVPHPKSKTFIVLESLIRALMASVTPRAIRTLRSARSQVAAALSKRSV